MNNELFNHQKSDAVKWVCTLLAFLIVGVLIAGIICGWFDKKETPPAEQTETGFIVTPDEINGVSLSVKAMSANGNEVNAMAETSYTVTATIQPSTALQKADWSLSWKDGNSSWANGKTVTDYVTLSAEDGAVTATVTLVKPFSEQIILTAKARGNAEKTATCTVDYQQRLIVNGLSIDGTPLSTETCNLKVNLFDTVLADLDYTFSEGSKSYFGQGSDGFDELIIGGLAFTDEFIAAYNEANGSATDITRKMNRANLGSEYEHTHEYDFDSGAAGQGVFNDLLGSIGLNDTSISYMRAAATTVGEENVFRLGIFKSTSAISDTFVDCDAWYKIGINIDSLFAATNSISVDMGSIVF